MFQLIGGTLAALAVILALTGSLFAGTAVALATLAWVTIARPTRRSVPERRQAAPWGADYGQPAVR